MLFAPDLFVVVRGAHAGHFSEKLGKIVPVLHAHQVADLREGQVGGGDELLGVVDAQNVDVGEYRRAGEGGEGPVQIVKIPLELLLNVPAGQVAGIVLVDVTQQLLRHHIGFSDAFSGGAAMGEQIFVGRFQQEAVEQGGGPALVMLLPAVVDLYGVAQLCLEFPAGQVELLGEISDGVRGVLRVQIVAGQTFPALIRQSRHGGGFVFHPAHVRVGEMDVVIVTGGALIALVGQSRFQQEKVSGGQVIAHTVLLQVEIPVPDHVEDPFVDAPGKVEPGLTVPDLAHHPDLGQQVCTVGEQHFLNLRKDPEGHPVCQRRQFRRVNAALRRILPGEKQAFRGQRISVGGGGVDARDGPVQPQVEQDMLRKDRLDLGGVPAVVIAPQVHKVQAQAVLFLPENGPDGIRLGIGGENAVPAGEADILIDAVRSGAADVHAGVFQGQLPIADDKITVFLDHRQEFGPQGCVIGVIAVPQDRPVFAKHQLGAAGGVNGRPAQPEGPLRARLVRLQKGLQIGRQYHRLAGAAPGLSDEGVQVPVAVVGGPDLNVYGVLGRLGHGLHGPVVYGVEDDTALRVLPADNGRRPVNERWDFLRQVHGPVLAVPDLLGEAVGVHVDAGKAESNGLAVFLQNMVRPAAAPGDVHVIQPPGKGHGLAVQGVHPPFRVGLEPLFGGGIDGPVGNGPDTAGLADGYFFPDDAQIHFPAQRVPEPVRRRKQGVVTVHPVVELYGVEVQVPEPLDGLRVPVTGAEIRQKGIAGHAAPVMNDVKGPLPARSCRRYGETVAAFGQTGQANLPAFPLAGTGNGLLQPGQGHFRTGGIGVEGQFYGVARQVLGFVQKSSQLHPFTAPWVRPPTTIFRWNSRNSTTTGISARIEAAKTHSQRVACWPLSRCSSRGKVIMVSSAPTSTLAVKYSSQKP